MKPPKTYPLTDAFIEQLKIKMQETKMKKTSLATLLGISKQYLNFWFQLPRSRNPNGENILRIQEILKIQETLK